MAILIAPDDTSTPRTSLVSLDAMTYGLGVVQSMVVEQDTVKVFVRIFLPSPAPETAGNTGGQHAYGHA